MIVQPNCSQPRLISAVPPLIASVTAAPFLTPAHVSAPSQNVGNTRNITPIIIFTIRSSEVFCRPQRLKYEWVSLSYIICNSQLSSQRTSSYQKVRKNRANCTKFSVITVFRSHVENCRSTGTQITSAWRTLSNAGNRAWLENPAPIIPATRLSNCVS